MSLVSWKSHAINVQDVAKIATNNGADIEMPDIRRLKPLKRGFLQRRGALITPSILGCSPKQSSIDALSTPFIERVVPHDAR